MFGNWRFGSTRAEKIEMEAGEEEADVHWADWEWSRELELMEGLLFRLAALRRPKVQDGAQTQTEN